MSLITAHTVILAAAVVGLTFIVNYLVQEASRLKELPGPPSHSRIAGHALDLQLAPVGTRYPVWAKKYGHTYRIHGAFIERHLVLGDPKGISHVLSTNAVNYIRPNTDRIVLGLWFPVRSSCSCHYYLILGLGDEHTKQRKILNPAFTDQSIKDVSHIFRQLADRLTQQWETILGEQNSSTFDIAVGLHALTLDAISMSMFMHDTSTGTGSNAIPDLLHNITNAPRGNMLILFVGSIVSMFPCLLSLPSPMKKWATTLRGELGRIAEGVWSGAKNDVGLDAKLLKLLSEFALCLPAQHDERGEQLNKDEVIANIIGVLFAGSESSANVISHLTGHPASFDDLMNPAALPYFDAVIREALRCKAVLMDIARVAVEDDVISLQFPVVGTGATTVRVKAGQSVMIPVRDGINSDEEIWGKDAREFRPERWLSDGLPTAVAAQGMTIPLFNVFPPTLFQMVVATVIRRFSLEDTGTTLDFYHLGGNTVKPKIQGQEGEGVQLPLRVRRL
ncbi:cytochrome P450 [Neolentinus lepideus HHB14362 ss-1]|uniref:Cytochrome P450 n=1 Tax=Neolentinus lepideus HHB14362 ss-1 TaxID=1314782 RepID=A0A165UJ60_9AGAM|nr:cytochrome P450 [Neolentinus lepideus HHB14362 ss-1]